MFRCYWDIPGGKRTAPNQDEQVCASLKTKLICFGTNIHVLCTRSTAVLQRLLESGPVESAGYDSLSLLAEQVSHHPPSKQSIYSRNSWSTKPFVSIVVVVKVTIVQNYQL